MRVAFLTLTFAAAVSFTLNSCSPREEALGDNPVIFVSIPPQIELVQQLAGERFEVRVLLGQGASHEAYEPKPSQLRDLSRATLYVRAYVPFENQAWDNIRASNSTMKVVSGFESVPARVATADEGQEHGHETGVKDPHLWLDPRNMKLQARAVAEALRALDPEHAADYDRNLARVVDDLDRLDSEVRAILKPVEGRSFWVYHPAWGYFADAYGLHQRAVEQEGLEPGARSLAALIERAKKDNVKVIFVDPQTSDRNARVVAREVGADLRELNPQAPDYLENLRRTARAIAEALQ